MKIELSEKQCRDIEWAILMTMVSVQKQYEIDNKKRKIRKETTSPLVKKLLKLHDHIKKERTNEVN